MAMLGLGSLGRGRWARARAPLGCMGAPTNYRRPAKRTAPATWAQRAQRARVVGRHGSTIPELLQIDTRRGVACVLDPHARWLPPRRSRICTSAPGCDATRRLACVEDAGLGEAQVLMLLRLLAVDVDAVEDGPCVDAEEDGPCVDAEEDGPCVE